MPSMYFGYTSQSRPYSEVCVIPGNTTILTDPSGLKHPILVATLAGHFISDIHLVFDS